MSSPFQPDPMDAAAKLNAALRELSDLLKGGISTLMAEGWTEEQARALVLRSFLTDPPR